MLIEHFLNDHHSMKLLTCVALFNTHFTEEGSQMLQSILFAALWSLALKESSSQCYWFDQLAERWKEGD